MNEAKKGAIKAGLVTFGLTLLATVIGGIIVDQFIRNKDQNAALAEKEAAQPPRQVVTTTVPVEEPATV